MTLIRKLSVLAAASLVSLAAPAGHLNAVLETELDGREEVATGATNSAIAGDPDGKGEAYVFGIDGDPTTLCYIVLVSKIADTNLPPGAPRAAHIHRGARGANGPVVANLAWPQNGQSADCLTEGEVLPNGALAFPSGALGIVQEILGNPTGFYVNIHNSEYPSGALRGQLSAVESH
jgi:hypothetical protein